MTTLHQASLLVAFFPPKHYLFSLCLFNILVLLTGFPGGSEGKASACNAGDPGGKIPWRRKWQPTPVILPGKSHGWRSLVGYSPCGRKPSNFTFTFFHSISSFSLLLYLSWWPRLVIFDVTIVITSRALLTTPISEGKQVTNVCVPPFLSIFSGLPTP